jgi:hypothetical protein
MVAEGSLPCSQKDATGPCPEQMNPIHNFPPYFPNNHFNIIFCVVSFLHRLSDKNINECLICSMHDICPPVSPFLTWSP